MKRKIIEINEELCNGCGDCVLSCAEGAIKIVNGKAKLISDKYCDGLGDCLGSCPTGALKIIEREAEIFDEALVQSKATPKPAFSCPSQRVSSKYGALNNWPIQLSLVSEDAEYCNNAGLLIAADCTAFAWSDYRKELKDKVLLICCPKLDDTDFYLAKLRKIFAKNRFKSITVVRMSVPCCSNLTRLIFAALHGSNAVSEFQEIIIDNSGSVSKKTISI